MDICPRCFRHSILSARSRMTFHAEILICEPCRIDEANRDAIGLAPIPPTDWPVSQRQTC